MSVIDPGAIRQGKRGHFTASCGRHPPPDKPRALAARALALTAGSEMNEVQARRDRRGRIIVADQLNSLCGVPRVQTDRWATTMTMAPQK